MSPTIVATYRNKKSLLREFLSTDAAIPAPSASGPQIEAAQQSV
jgi:hypothetical protein